MEDKSTRRDFLKRAAIGSAAIAGVPAALQGAWAEGASAPAPTGGSRVILAKNTAMLSGDDANQTAVQQTLYKAIAALTAQKSAAAAWESLFKPDDIVGIKINCLCGKTVSTRPEVVSAVISGLKLAGVKPDNIIVWDRSTADMAKSGYMPNKTGPGVRYWADDGEWGQEIKNGSFNGRISTLFDKITALVNLPIIKHHGFTGMSGAMKNHYGSFNNPGDHHKNHGEPYLADLNSIPQIKDKTRLIVADALKPQADGGPRANPPTQWEYHTLMVSRDPVAIDTLAFELIDARRKETGFSSIEKSGIWLPTCAARGLGTNDKSKMDIVRI